MAAGSENELVRVSAFVSNWPINEAFIRTGVARELIHDSSSVVNEVFKGCRKIAGDRGANAIDGRSVRLYADVLRLDRLQAFPTTAVSQGFELVGFLREDHELLRQVLEGPWERLYSPLPESTWNPIASQAEEAQAGVRMAEGGIVGVSGVLNRGLLELLAASYLDTWTSLAKCLKDLRDLGVTVGRRPSTVVIQERQIPHNCDLLPFPLNFLD